MPSNQKPADGDAENTWSGSGNPNGVNQADETEPVEAEVIEHNPALSPEVEALATFAEQDGPLAFRVLPVIQGGQTDWRVVTYMRGVQGTLYQSRDGITDKARAEFGISSMLQDRINSALKYAKDNLHIPPELGDQKRAKRSLRDLELMMQEG